MTDAMRITRIGAENVRAIGKIDLALAPLTVILGPNGVGKSTLLQIARTFAGLDDKNRFIKCFAGWGGFPASVRYNTSSVRNSMGIGVSKGNQQHQYLIRFMREGAGFFVEAETLRSTFDAKRQFEEVLSRDDTTAVLTTSRGVFHKVQLHGASPFLADFRHELPQIDSLLEAAKRTTLWAAHEFQPAQRAHSPQQLQQTTGPSSDGSTLFSALYSLKTERRERYSELVEALQSAIPELEELEFPLAGAGHVSLAWKQSNFAVPFFSNQLSDGILRFLFLVTILHTAPDDGLVLLDEPEISLHPRWLMLLVSLLRKATSKTNILVATQSSELVRWLKPEELVIANATPEGTTFTPATSKPDLNRWLEDFTLSELWLMGELGGRL